MMRGSFSNNARHMIALAGTEGIMPTALETAILDVAIEAGERRCYGYQIRQQLEARHFRSVGVSAAGVYRAIASCVEEGWLLPDGLQSGDGPARVIYRTNGLQTVSAWMRGLHEALRVANEKKAGRGRRH